MVQFIHFEGFYISSFSSYFIVFLNQLYLLLLVLFDTKLNILQQAGLCMLLKPVSENRLILIQMKSTMR